MRTIKKVASHIFIDGFGGMTQGLFATLIIGTMIQQIGLLIGGSTGNVIYLLGKAAAALTSAGIGVGVAVKYGESPLVTVSAAVAAMVGGYAGKITGGTFFVDGNAVLAGPGEPLGAFIAAFAGITCGRFRCRTARRTADLPDDDRTWKHHQLGNRAAAIHHGHRCFGRHGYGSDPADQLRCTRHHSESFRSCRRCRNDRLLLQHGRIRGCKLSGKQIRRPRRTGSWNLDAPGAEHHASSADLAARHLLECDFRTRLHDPRQYAE